MKLEVSEPTIATADFGVFIFYRAIIASDARVVGLLLYKARFEASLDDGKRNADVEALWATSRDKQGHKKMNEREVSVEIILLRTSLLGDYQSGEWMKYKSSLIRIGTSTHM